MSAAPVVASAIPVLPDIAWRGLAGRYRDVVSPCTEAPEVFHFGSFIAAVGCLIGRRAWICTPHETYSNFYCLLVGRTGHTRKSTSYEFAVRLLEDARYVMEAPTKRLNGLASGEGLAAAMRDSKSNHGLQVLCIEDEFKSLITKSGFGNIIPKLTELFNSPPTFEVNTKTDPIRIQNPFLCMLAATTRAWFEDSLSANDVSGGFLNRWLLFEGEPERLLAFPPPLNKRDWDDLVVEICLAIDRASGHYEFSPSAKVTYETFYAAARKKYHSEATARIDLHTKKLAMVYAILAGHKQIQPDDTESAIAVAEYCASIVDPLAQRLEISPQKRVEERCLAVLREGPIRARDAYRKLHVSSGDLLRVIESLRRAEQIRYEGGLYHLCQ